MGVDVVSSSCRDQEGSGLKAEAVNPLGCQTVPVGSVEVRLSYRLPWDL